MPYTSIPWLKVDINPVRKVFGAKMLQRRLLLNMPSDSFETIRRKQKILKNWSDNCAQDLITFSFGVQRKETKREVTISQVYKMMWWVISRTDPSLYLTSANSDLHQHWSAGKTYRLWHNTQSSLLVSLYDLSQHRYLLNKYAWKTISWL